MTYVHEEMRDMIRQQLKQIEQEEQVRIIYACESGSRAWGFPSQDSDYDVRFLYVRPLEWYLSIEDKRDVIERPISDQLDINGWDLRKALKLFRKSNPPLLEWLQSPIQYDEQYSVAQHIRALSPLTFSPKSCMYHYLNMAKGNFRDYLQGDQVRIKSISMFFAPYWLVAGSNVMMRCHRWHLKSLCKNLYLRLHRYIRRFMSYYAGKGGRGTGSGAEVASYTSLFGGEDRAF